MTDSGIQWTSIDAPKSIPPRWRWIGFLVALAVVGGLVAFALIEGDKIVRGIASDVVRSGVASALQLPEGQEIDVELGEGLLVFQALSGSIDSVDVAIPGVPFGAATGTLKLTVNGVSLDPTAPVDTLQARVELDADAVSKYAGNLSSAPLTAVTLPGQVVAITADLGGQPVSAALVPTVSNGAVVFTPVEVAIAGVAVPIPDIMAGPLAAAAGPMLTSTPVCLAQYLPEALTVAGAVVENERLVITAVGNATRLAGLGKKGTCDVPAA
jgi:hypothetical protein